jgi:hypothetical protein
MSPEELKDTYAKASTEKLMEIIDNKFDYTELAVKTALEELSRREVTDAENKAYKKKIQEKAAADVRKLLLDDLSLFHKNFFYFLWLPLVHFAVKRNFVEDGYYLKVKQAGYYSLLGFAFLMLSSFISLQFDLSELTTLALWIAGFIPTYAFDETFNRRQIIKRLMAKHQQKQTADEVEH